MNKIIAQVNQEVFMEVEVLEDPIYVFKNKEKIECKLIEDIESDTFVIIKKINDGLFTKVFSNLEELQNPNFIGFGFLKGGGQSEETKEISILYWGEE